ncbi:MAG: crossover junction endodeoxyribonuclease RuvC [Planctomycetes bacterium]|nr:crossover junction endodeoxyribonuclease RuvC [Planctomycetota bacterium]
MKEEGTSEHRLHAAREARAVVPIVLGIDPGTRVVGYGAVVVAAKGPKLLACGALRAERDDDVPVRLAWLRGELDRLLAKVKPTVVVVEAAFAARNVQSALRIGEGRGVVLACAAATGAKIVQYPPAVAKKALLGHGAADKTQVAWMVGELLGLAKIPEPLDATDALALALAWVQRGEQGARSRVGGRAGREELPEAIRVALEGARRTRGVGRRG